MTLFCPALFPFSNTSSALPANQWERMQIRMYVSWHKQNAHEGDHVCKLMLYMRTWVIVCILYLRSKIHYANLIATVRCEREQTLQRSSRALLLEVLPRAMKEGRGQSYWRLNRFSLLIKCHMRCISLIGRMHYHIAVQSQC